MLSVLLNKMQQPVIPTQERLNKWKRMQWRDDTQGCPMFSLCLATHQMVSRERCCIKRNGNRDDLEAIFKRHFKNHQEHSEKNKNKKQNEGCGEGEKKMYDTVPLFTSPTFRGGGKLMSPGPLSWKWEGLGGIPAADVGEAGGCGLAVRQLSRSRNSWSFWHGSGCPGAGEWSSDPDFAEAKTPLRNWRWVAWPHPEETAGSVCW